MTKEWQRDMAEATRLTQSGKPAEATTLLQRLLGRKPAAARSAQGSTHTLPAPTIDGTATVVPEPDAADAGGLRRIFNRPKAPATPAAAPAAQRAKTMTTGAHFVSKSFSNEAGTRAYKLYIPSGYDGTPRPLIVMLHGCSQSADDFAAGTHMNACAQEHGCFVAYPEQPSSANAQKCWNWFNSAEQVRGKGEPLWFAGLTRDISAQFAIDQRRIYAAGLSAGGAAAAVLAETYPDIFAAIGVHSGLACGAARDMTSAFMAMGGKPQRQRPDDNAARALVPTIVFHGDRDTTVHPRNGADVVARAKAIADLQTLTETHTIRGRSVTRSLYRDKRGNTVIEDWVVHGAGHTWSGGNTAGSYVDAKGPDASREMLRFFLAHSLAK